VFTHHVVAVLAIFGRFAFVVTVLSIFGRFAFVVLHFTPAVESVTVLVIRLRRGVMIL
jgi:hypothetical protein